MTEKACIREILRLMREGWTLSPAVPHGYVLTYGDERRDADGRSVSALERTLRIAWVGGYYALTALGAER